MLNAGHLFLRIVTGFIIGPIAALIAWGFFSLPFLICLFTGVVGFVLTQFTMKWIQRRNVQQKFSLTKSEYKLIDEQLQEASESVRLLSSLFTKVRSIRGFRQLYDMNKTVKRIVNIVKTNPSKFFRAETFFYAHLPSITELAEKFVLLSREKIKDYDVKVALRQTEEALNDYKRIIEKDLRDVLADDIESLKMELDFAKMTSKRHEENTSLQANTTQPNVEDVHEQEFEHALAELKESASTEEKDISHEQQDIPYKEPELIPVKKHPKSRMEKRYFNDN